MILYIKYMVSLRCKLIVKEQLEKFGLEFVVADLGTVEIVENITPDQREQMAKGLKKSGMELLDDTKGSLIDKIIDVVDDLIKNADKGLPMDFTQTLTEKLGYQPKLLTDIFSEVKGISIRQFIIMQKVERAKELLLYENLTVEKISKLLQFNSRNNLSYQFKKLTGLTPLYYKELKKKRKNNMKRITSSPLDQPAG